MQKLNTMFFIVPIMAMSISAYAANGTAAPDNSAQNEKIEQHQEMNSQDQGNSKADLELTRKIRQEIVKMDSFSTDAKNVKIISLNGKVTLKGPVHSADEKSKIEQIAVRIASKKNVSNEITIENK